MIKILFLIRALEYGGAERQLIDLARELDDRCFAVTVATMYDGGALRPELAASDRVGLVTLHKRGRWDVLHFGRHLVDLVRFMRPDIVHGYLDGPNLLALGAARLVGAQVVWGLRVGSVVAAGPCFTRAIIRAGALLSSRADLMIANSQAGAYGYGAAGFARTRLVVIPNGIDTQRFRPDAAAGRRQRAIWGIPPDAPLIGLVGRLDPIKDHATFLAAAALLRAWLPGARFVCVGDGPPTYRRALQGQAQVLGLAHHLLWVEGQDEMPSVYNSLDLLTSASISEGFSNVIGEAMACGVPVVATDVGDAALLLGACGGVVPARSPGAMAHAWQRLLAQGSGARIAVGLQGRERVARYFSLTSMVERHAAWYGQLVAQRLSRRSERGAERGQRW